MGKKNRKEQHEAEDAAEEARIKALYAKEDDVAEGQPEAEEAPSAVDREDDDVADNDNNSDATEEGDTEHGLDDDDDVLDEAQPTITAGAASAATTASATGVVTAPAGLGGLFLSAMQAKQDAQAPFSFMLVLVCFLLQFLVPVHEKARVESALAAAAAEREKAAAAEAEARTKEAQREALTMAKDHFWSPAKQGWMPMVVVAREDCDGVVVPSLRFDASRGIYERWQKNLQLRVKSSAASSDSSSAAAAAAAGGKKKNKKAPKLPAASANSSSAELEAEKEEAGSSSEPGNRAGGQWIRFKAGDGVASAPSVLSSKDGDIPSRRVRFFVCLKHSNTTGGGGSGSDKKADKEDEVEVVVDATEWVKSTAVMTADDAIAMGVLDGSKAPLQVDYDVIAGMGWQVKLRKGFVLPTYGGGAYEEEGDEGHGDGKMVAKAKKEKLSRADKREMKNKFGGRR